MVGRIYKITATKTHHEHVIIEAFNILESRDRWYRIPTMCMSLDERYQVVSPSVSCTLLSTKSHCSSPLNRIYCSFSTFNMTVKVGSVATQTMGPGLNLRRRLTILRKI